MREIFEEIFVNQPLDPMESARRGARPQARKRFYQRAEAGEGTGERGGPFPILLDGKPVRTPARRALAAPTHALAEALAAEWDDQRELIDPAAMPLTRLANSIIDGVADAPDRVADDIAKFLGTDLLFYRADGPEGLLAMQAEQWDPVVEWARDTFGARFILAQGIVHVAQAEAAIAAARVALPSDPWRLGALHVVTTLTGSALLALALAQNRLSADAVWQAAHVDEDWNMQQWGGDDEMLARRAARAAEMQAAATVLALLDG